MVPRVPTISDAGVPALTSLQRLFFERNLPQFFVVSAATHRHHDRFIRLFPSDNIPGRPCRSLRGQRVRLADRNPK